MRFLNTDCSLLSRLLHGCLVGETSPNATALQRLHKGRAPSCTKCPLRRAETPGPENLVTWHQNEERKFKSLFYAKVHEEFSILLRNTMFVLLSKKKKKRFISVGFLWHEALGRRPPFVWWLQILLDSMYLVGERRHSSIKFNLLRSWWLRFSKTNKSHHR